MTAVALVVTACTGARDDSALRPVVDREMEALSEAADRCLYSKSPERIPHDGAFEIGALANGLAYYVYSNDVPAGHLDLRLVVKAGSRHDADEASGAAHFVEHMLFNGTERYPRNELHQALRDIGVEFGPDENAFTTFDSTQYVLSITTSGTERLVDKLPVAFEILSEWASEATIADADVEAERGIVANELALWTGSAEGQLRQAVDDLLLAGTRYAGRQPAGSPESIAAITPEQLRHFYSRWYAPFNMAVVAVGDVEVAKLRDLVEEHFSKIPPIVDEWSPQFTVTSGAPSEPRFGHVIHADYGNPMVSVNWQTPAWPRGTLCGERYLLLEQLAHHIVSTRLRLAYEEGLLSQANAPERLAPVENAAVPYISTRVQGEDLEASLRDLWSVVAGPLQQPFTAEEYRLASGSVRAELERAVEHDQFRHDSDYAFDFAAHFVRGADLQSAADRSRRSIDLLEATTNDELTAYYAWMLSRSAPVVVAAGPPGAELPTSDSLLAALDSALEGSTSPLASDLAESDDLMSLMGRPEAVEFERSATTSLGSGLVLHEWWFDNGAHVVLDTSLIGSEVFVATESLGGGSLLQPSEVPLAQYALQAVASSGLAGLTASQVSAVVEESGTWMIPVLDHTTENFVGAGPSDQLETLFAWLHLLTTEPRISDAAARDAQQSARNAIAQAQTSALLQAQIAFAAARNDKSGYFDRIPDAAAIDEMTPARLLGIYRERFVGVDDLTVAIVGDVDPAEVADLARRYIGTLPARPSDTGIDLRPPHPPGVTRVEVEADTAAESGVEFVYELAVDLSPRLVATANVLAAVLNELLTTEVREGLGQSYVAQASITALHQPAPMLLGVVTATGPGEALDEIEERIAAVIGRLATEGPSTPNLAQAITIVANDAHFGGSGFPPLVLLMRRTVDDADLPLPHRIEGASAEVKAVDVRDLARSLLDSGQRIEIVRVSAPAS
jgi:zinc protease